MFGWIKKKDPYPEHKRKIFSYFNGERTIHADPMVLYKRLMEIGPELSIDIKVSRSQSKDAPKSFDEMVKKICNVFNIKRASPFEMDRGGLGEADIPGILWNFLTWVESEKKNLRPSVTSQIPTEDFKISSNANQPMKNSSGFGSIVKESSTAVQEQLLTERP